MGERLTLWAFNKRLTKVFAVPVDHEVEDDADGGEKEGRQVDVIPELSLIVQLTVAAPARTLLGPHETR